MLTPLPTTNQCLGFPLRNKLDFQEGLFQFVNLQFQQQNHPDQEASRACAWLGGGRLGRRGTKLPCACEASGLAQSSVGVHTQTQRFPRITVKRYHLKVARRLTLCSWKLWSRNDWGVEGWRDRRGEGEERGERSRQRRNKRESSGKGAKWEQRLRRD